VEHRGLGDAENRRRHEQGFTAILGELARLAF
jgi:hypothetical protein